MTTTESILRRIARELGGEGVVEALARLSPRDFSSLLLHLLDRRSEDLAPGEVLARYEATPAFAPSFAEPRLSAAFLQAAFEAASAFEAIELAPVCPLGTTRAFGKIHQNNVLSASRGAELVADPTPVLALECARRRRDPQERARTIRLCTSQRLMRMQPLPIPGLLPHFRLFALVTSGQRSPSFDAEALREHLAVYLRLFRSLNTKGFCVNDVTLNLADTEAIEQRLVGANIDPMEVRRSVRTNAFPDPDELLAERGLAQIRGKASEVLGAVPGLSPHGVRRLEGLQAQVLDPLTGEFPEVQMRLDLSRLEGLGFYRGPCIRVTARDPSGATLPLVDGGFTDWTERLLSDGRERFLTTGIGSDLVCARFVSRASAESPQG